MSCVTFLFGPGLFFTPLIYVPLYLYIERSFSQHTLVQYILKAFTVLGGLFLIIYAFTAGLNYNIPVPSKPGTNNYVPASIAFSILGGAMMTLPLYSKYIRFTNKES